MYRPLVISVSTFVAILTCGSAVVNGARQYSDVDRTKPCSKLDFDKCAPSEKEKVVICYFTNWSWYRNGSAKYGPENINASLCTHIIYSFATLDNETLTIAPYDSYVDIDNKFYEKVVALKKEGVKILCGIGGWTDSGFEKWSKLISNQTARENFVKSVLDFFQKYGFEGLDMDYEYPGCPQGNKTSGYPDAKVKFNTLMTELKEAFKGDYSLSVATAGGKDIIDNCYEMTPLCSIVDWVNVMTYDYYSYLDNETAPNAPMCGTGDNFGVYETIQYYVKTLDCPSEKLVLGLPFYGKSYTLKDPQDNSAPEFGLGIEGAGNAGEYTKSPGTLSYYEVCQAFKDGYQSDYNKVNGSYIWKGDQFISYDGISTINRKSCLVNKYFNLRGAMLWALDHDDFNNLCGCGSHPLLKTLNRQMGRLPPQYAVTCY